LFYGNEKWLGKFQKNEKIGGELAIIGGELAMNSL
jgi:hypothetical protein